MPACLAAGCNACLPVQHARVPVLLSCCSCVKVVSPCLLLIHRECKQTWLDSGHLQLLPKGIQQLLPMEMTSRSGLGVVFTHLLKTLPSQGVSVGCISRTYNELLMTSHYERQLGFLSQLEDSMSRGEQVQGQVSAGVAVQVAQCRPWQFFGNAHAEACSCFHRSTLSTLASTWRTPRSTSTLGWTCTSRWG